MFQLGKKSWTLGAALACILCSPSALAQAQTNLTTPVASAWLTGVNQQAIDNQNNAGFRIVDIEVETANPITFSAAFVRNAGSYAKAWWWNYGMTDGNVNSMLASNNARLIDLEPYSTPAGVRFAAVMVSNTGADFASDHGWQFGLTGSQLGSWIGANQDKRIIDLQPYTIGGNSFYACVWVQNSGTQQSAWWILYGTSMSTINNFLGPNNARLIDLEEDSSGTFSALMVPGDGKSTYHLTNLQLSQVGRYIDQFASRIIDIERKTFFLIGNRYSIILRQNDNDLAIASNNAMRAQLPLGASSGLSLVRLDGTFSTEAGVKETSVFEPASLMKTAHLFSAMLQIVAGNDNLTNAVAHYTGLNGSCPTGTGPVSRSYYWLLKRMMEQSSNTATETVRARMGTPLIESTMAFIGAGNVRLNHTLGCLCGNPRNEATLMDFANIHRAVANGGIGAYEDDFHEIMLNSSSFGMGSFGTGSILSSELSSSTLPLLTRQTFANGVSFAHKGGSYSCPATPEQHRSQGVYIRLPYRSGCDTNYREYFLGAWVNDATTSSTAENAVGAGMVELYRHLLQEAITTWEQAPCTPFVNYCTTVPNSTGLSSTAYAQGSPFILGNDFNMNAHSLPQNVFCFLLVGTQDAFVQNPGGSLGNLCVGGEIGRYWASLQNTGSQGTVNYPVNLNAIPKPTPPSMPVQAGETLYFQWWHRDTVNGAPASNFTNGLRATFI